MRACACTHFTCTHTYINAATAAAWGRTVRAAVLHSRVAAAAADWEIPAASSSSSSHYAQTYLFHQLWIFNFLLYYFTRLEFLCRAGLEYFLSSLLLRCADEREDIAESFPQVPSGAWWDLFRPALIRIQMVFGPCEREVIDVRGSQRIWDGASAREWIPNLLLRFVEISPEPFVRKSCSQMVNFKRDALRNISSCVSGICKRIFILFVRSKNKSSESWT